MAQRPSNLALAGAAAGSLALLSATGSGAFVAAPREANAPSLRGTSAAQAQAPSAPAPSFSALAAGGAVAAAAVAAGRSGRQARSSILPTTVVPVKDSRVTRKALDQSSRYADLSLDEATLIKNGKHVLVAYIMKPKAGYDYLATAAHFAAESSTGTNVNVCTTDDFTKSVDALVYYIDPDSEEMKIAYPNLLFDRNIIDGRGMMCSFLTLSIGNNQGMGDVEYGKIYDFYLPPAFLRLYDGPAVNVEDMWRILGKGTSNGGLVVGTIIKPKLGLQPKPFGEACYAFWQGGDFIKNDEPQGNQVFCQMNEVIPEVVKAMRACIKETGVGKLFSANITADDPNEMIARGKYCMSQFGPLSENCAFLVDGYVAGGTAVTCARRNFPKQFLHYHRAGHGSVTSPQTQRGYTAFVHTKISRVIGASGIHTGTMSFGKMEGDASDKNIAFMLQDDEADGPYYHQEWEGMKQTTPIISGGMNALRLPAFFENLGHSNVILTAGGGSFGHKDGPKPGAISCRQGEEAWKAWKSGQYGNISLSDGVIEFAKTHEEIKGAFLTFQKDADQIYPGWKEKLGYTGESSVQAASFDWAKKASAAAFVGASMAPAKKQSSVSRKALDQSSRYADLSLDEATLIKNGKHVLVAYIMKPKAGYDYLATAAHFAAESSTGTNVNVCTTDDFTKSVDALVYYIDPDSEEMKIAYPNLLFDRNIIDGRGMMCSFLTLSIGNNQGMGDVEYGKIYDFYLPPAFLRLYDGPAVNVEDMWRILGKGTSNGGLVVGTIIKPKLGLQPKPFGEACYAFWQGGDFIKNDEPQGNQVFCQMNEVIPEVVKAMRACIKETGVGKLFSANITADDPNEMIARGKYCMSQFGPLSENCAFLVDGYVAGGTAVTCARRNFPKQFLHYHRAGHGSVTSPQTQRGYTAFVHTKISRVIGASGIHTGTMSFGKMEGDASDKNIAFMLQDDEADGPYYHQEWEGMKQTTPIISGGMNALRLPAFENLGHSNVILTAGGGSFGHKDGPKPGAISCRQGEEAWKAWKSGQYGNISLSDGVIEFAKTHEEIKGAFLTFQKDADQIYPGWKEKLGYTGESSVQAASFDWAKKASAAAFVGCSSVERTPQVARAVTPYELNGNVLADLEFSNDVGYLPDGTPMNRAGNAINHPENIGPDSHAPGSPLPRANFVNSVGYLPDGTPMNRAGNAINHPETIGPDLHTPGSPLPASTYAQDVGYLVDGTPMETAGNLSVQGGAAPAAAPAAAAAPAPVVAAAFVGSSAATPSKVRHAGNFAYGFQRDAFCDLEFSNDIGYLPDGTPMNMAGNAINHPENIQPDSHAPGSPLPSAIFANDVGYLPDGTPMNRAGNAINHPENIGPDMHTPGSPLPASTYAQDVGYLVDGTPMETAGNLSVQ